MHDWHVSTSPSTAWQRIARDVADRILSGETPVGAKIASHQELADRHGSSLGTVKRAVDHLRDVGVLQGVQGSGVFVRREPREADLDFGATAGPGYDELLKLRAEVETLRDRLDVLEASSRDAANSGAAGEDELRKTVGAIQAHLIELYGRVGQPYPGARGQTRTARRTARRAADG